MPRCAFALPIILAGAAPSSSPIRTLPPGIALPRAEIERLASERADAPVVIDEAYVDFGAETVVPLIRKHPNLLVVQTLSKSRALAGLRVGYAIGDQALTRVKDSFNSYPLGRPAQAGAIAAIQDDAYFQRTRSTIIANRGRLTATLIRLGFDVLPSSANFVLAHHPTRRRPRLVGRPA
jgi:histidinol-phosphate aminotransferase